MCKSITLIKKSLSGGKEEKYKNKESIIVRIYDTPKKGKQIVKRKCERESCGIKPSECDLLVHMNGSESRFHIRPSRTWQRRYEENISINQ